MDNSVNVNTTGLPTGGLPTGGLPTGGLGGLPTGGLPTGGLPTGGLGGLPAGGSAPATFGNTGISSLDVAENDLRIIGYIAPSYNVQKDGIDTVSAKKKFDEAFKKYTEQPNAVLTKTCLNADGVEKKKKKESYQVTLTTKFSMDALYTFFPEIVKELKAENKKTIDISESRAAYYVIRNCIDANSNSFVAIGGSLEQNGPYDYTNSIAILKPTQLVSFMGNNDRGSIPVFIGYDGATSIGSAFIQVGRQTSADKEQNVNLVFTTTDYVKVPSIRALKDATGARVPYAVYANKTVAASAPIDGSVENKVLNIKKFRELFPEKTDAEIANLPVRYIVKKSEFNDEEEYKKAKQAQLVKYEDQKAVLDQMGVREEIYNNLSTSSSSSGRKTTLFTLKASAQQAAEEIKKRAAAKRNKAGNGTAK